MPILLAILLLSGAAAVAAQRPWAPVATIDGDPVMRGLPRDAIPAIDDPVFMKGAGARFMRPDEYVIGITDGRTAKAYSAWHLNGHEIVNDRLGDRAIAVTWCPLCFTGIVYDRRVGDRVLSFGVSGMLWRENLVMYDRETDSWWSQATGDAIRGHYEGTALTMLAATMTTWQDWLTRHPDTLVLSKITVDGMAGRSDAYADYHASRSLGVTGRLRRTNASGLDDKARVLGFRLEGRPFVVPLEALAGGPIVLPAPHRGTVEPLGGGAGGRVVLMGGEDQSPTEVPSSLSYWFAWRAFFPESQVLGGKR